MDPSEIEQLAMANQQQMQQLAANHQQQQQQMQQMATSHQDLREDMDRLTNSQKEILSTLKKLVSREDGQGSSSGTAGAQNPAIYPQITPSDVTMQTVQTSNVPNMYSGRQSFSPKVYTGEKGESFMEWLDILFACARANKWDIATTHDAAQIHSRGSKRERMMEVKLNTVTSLEDLKDKYKGSVVGVQGKISPYENCFGINVYRKQGETLNHFKTRLNEAWKLLCGQHFDHVMIQKMMVKAFIIGLNDKNLREKILDQPEADFETTVKFAQEKLMERADQKLETSGQVLRPDDVIPGSVNKLGKNDDEDDVNKIAKGGKKPVCFECQKPGHLAKDCFRRKNKEKKQPKKQGKKKPVFKRKKIQELDDSDDQEDDQKDFR